MSFTCEDIKDDLQKICRCRGSTQHKRVGYMPMVEGPFPGPKKRGRRVVDDGDGNAGIKLCR